MNQSCVYVVHCLDAEGPLCESIEATFERLQSLFGLNLEPSSETLRSLQNKKIDLGGAEDDVALVVAPHLLDYNDSWDKIDSMLLDALSPEFRNKVLDSFGGGWIYNWHCLDHVGFTENPRQRDFGYHRVFDHFLQILSDTKSDADGVHFHHHPVPFNRKAHHQATHLFSNTPIIYEILSRRIIERGWFTCVNRPGFNVTRPDSNWFLEQFIPFDYANQSSIEIQSAEITSSSGRYGDWRRAPKSWQPYHPDHDDYQVSGNSRRWIARCLNIGTRHSLLSKEDVVMAFDEAQAGNKVILAFTNHDFRDIRPDVLETRKLIEQVAKTYPGINFKYCEAREAFREAMELPYKQPFDFDVRLEGEILRVDSSAKIFGPQPFLAIRTKEGNFFHDNFDIQMPFNSWTYTFDEFTFPLDTVSHIGVGASDDYGNVCCRSLDMETGLSTRSCY